jgi:hypothetical protein
MKSTLIALLGLALATLVHAAAPQKPEPFEDALREAVKGYRAGKGVGEKELPALARDVDRRVLKQMK